MAGRPTKYTDDMPQRVLEWLKSKQDEVKFNGSVPTLTVKLPTMEGLASHLDVNKTTLYEWEKDHARFSNALDRVRTEQHDRLISSGLSGAYNSTIAKLVLSSNHGYTDKKEVKTDMNLNLNEASDEELRRIAGIST